MEGLTCTRCGRTLALAGEVLACPGCPRRVPVAHGIVFHTEAWDEGDEGAARWAGLAARLRPGDAEMAALAERGAGDAYAAFQPFNESARTLDGFLPALDRLLAGGGRILDTWNRSGWSGVHLAARFPACQVVSIWEGNHDVLGYRGFVRWLASDARPANLHILFHDLDRPLPFPDDHFAFVHGHDSLHRYREETFVPELVRVCRPDGALLFPHVHLANAQPQPYFPREGRLRHGREVEALLAAHAGPGRRAFVVGECARFVAPPGQPLASEPDTRDHNGVAGVVPEAWLGEPLGGEGRPRPDWAALPSPLVELDARGVARLAPAAAPLLARHPVQARRLRLPRALDARERLVSFWAERCADLADLARRSHLSAGELDDVLQCLADDELVRVVPLGRAGRRLQRFHARRELAPLADEDSLPALWRSAQARHPARSFLIDAVSGARLSYADAEAIVVRLAARLVAAGAGPGRTVALCAPAHVEAALLFWATTRIGARLAVLDHEADPRRTRELLARLAPALLFVDAAGRDRLGDGVVLDGNEPHPRGFAAWLAGEAAAELPAPPRADDDALVLFTSGTSGEPRGVVLSHASLCHSGRSAARHFRLRADDVHLGSGDFHTMSGLRNPLVATVCAGAAALIAGPPRDLPALVDRFRVSVLTTVPATLAWLCELRPRLPAGALASLRLVLCTGSRLPGELLARFEATVARRVVDYYGLTETGGLCLAQPSEGERVPGLGLPVDALVRVVDADTGVDRPPGQLGELWVASPGLMSRYLDDEAGTRERLRGGWLRTGDLGRLDEHGHVVLSGRAQEMHKNDHGELVGLGEIDEALLTDEVADAAACVIEERGRERVIACLVPSRPLAAGEASRWLDGQRTRIAARLGAKKRPAEVRLLAAIPRSPAGKVLRDRLAEVVRAQRGG